MFKWSSPLENQQANLVLGFHDKEKWNPILKPNPNFNQKLQHEGVTCAVCHIRNGKILGPYAIKNTPHPIEKMKDSNQVCMRCHVVQGARWDTFYQIPPCGTVAEIKSSGEKKLNCVQCHMPLVNRPIVAGGKRRLVRRHLWRGGHDLKMVQLGLQITFKKEASQSENKSRYVLTLTNVGAAHYIPTGTPDRHLTVRLRVLGKNKKILKEKSAILKRTILWRPFIIDLWDTRLKRWKPQVYSITFFKNRKSKPLEVEAMVRYYLLAESRRKKIGYHNKSPIFYEIFHKIILIEH